MGEFDFLGCNKSLLSETIFETKEQTMTDHYDVIIIGTGAGGGTPAYKLAGSGKRILLLERGDFLPHEKENWDATTVSAKNKYTTTEHWYDSKGKLFQPGQHDYVGGNTKFFGAVLFRMRREDFGEINHYGSISPAWPLNYDDMEPYYTEAEKNLSCARCAWIRSNRAARTCSLSLSRDPP